MPQYPEFKRRLYNKGLLPEDGEPFTIDTFAQHKGTKNCVAKMLTVSEESSSGGLELMRPLLEVVHLCTPPRLSLAYNASTLLQKWTQSGAT